MLSIELASPNGKGVALVNAPESEEGLAAVLENIPDDARIVVVREGGSLARVLLCEELRLRRQRVVITIDDVDEASAETLVLSGRVDAVARMSEFVEAS